MQPSFTHHFITIHDPRRDNRSHLLIDIIMIAICATLAGAEGWTEIARHGRIEKRICEVMSGTDIIDRLRHKNNWLNLNTIVKVTATRTMQSTGEVTEHTRHYICSREEPSAEYIQHAVREHWSIENSLHWVLDMSMREDESRIRTDHGPENMAILRHIALNLVRLDTTRKVGVKASIKQAGWDMQYLEKLLGV